MPGVNNRPGGATNVRPGANNNSILRPGPNDRPGAGIVGPGGNGLPGVNNANPPRPGQRPNLPGNNLNPGRDINIGNVNIGNSVDISKDRQAWIDNRHVTGNEVRVNAGNRYANVYQSGAYRRGVVGGYPYYSHWDAGNPYAAWAVPTFAAVGGFLGASFATAQPVYYGYGNGGNVYYENNTVYVDGQASGTPQEYAQQALSAVSAAPAADQVSSEDWMPLGVFALSAEDVGDSQSMIELAVNKQGVLAGTYYNESTSVSRPLKGTIDQKTQRAVVGFADGKNSDVALETGIYNLTQDEAPGLLHQGAEQSTPVLLVRLKAPEKQP